MIYYMGLQEEKINVGVKDVRGTTYSKLGRKSNHKIIFHFV